MCLKPLADAKIMAWWDLLPNTNNCMSGHTTHAWQETLFSGLGTDPNYTIILKWPYNPNIVCKVSIGESWEILLPRSLTSCSWDPRLVTITPVWLPFPTEGLPGTQDHCDPAHLLLFHVAPAGAVGQIYWGHLKVSGARVARFLAGCSVLTMCKNSTGNIGTGAIMVLKLTVAPMPTTNWLSAESPGLRYSHCQFLVPYRSATKMFYIMCGTFVTGLPFCGAINWLNIW